MNLNQHFDFSRFFKFLKFNIFINTKKYLIFLGVILIVLLVFDIILIDSASTFRTLENNNREYFFRKSSYQYSFIITFLVVMVLVVSSAFPEFRKKESTTSFLLFPVSILEKLLLQVFVRIFLFSLFYVVIFWLDFKLATIIYRLLNFKGNILLPNFTLMDFYPDKISFFLEETVIFLSIISFASYLLASASYFKKNVTLKTIILFGCFGFLIFLINILFSHLFLPNEVNGFEIIVFNRILENKLSTIQICICTIGIFSSLFLMPLTYAQLKEKQV
jgi:hypothetical protein